MLWKRMVLRTGRRSPKWSLDVQTCNAFTGGRRFSIQLSSKALGPMRFVWY
jgi:hypothetical protein